MIRMLDAGWPASTPQGVIADCKALGGQIIGLYDANWSAAGAQRTTAFLDAVDQGGIPVLPICTPGNTPPASAAEVLGIMVGAGLKHKFCAFDLEQYSFPPTAWVTQCLGLLHGAGWKVIGYGFESTKGVYGPCGFDYWWGVLNYAQPYGYIPGWCDAFQYNDKLIGPSGADYDGSTVSNALAAAFLGDPAPVRPLGEIENVVTFETPNQLHVAGVNSKGEAWVAWFDKSVSPGKWAVQQIGSNLVAGQQLGVALDFPVAGQVNLFGFDVSDDLWQMFYSGGKWNSQDVSKVHS